MNQEKHNKYSRLTSYMLRGSIVSTLCLFLFCCGEGENRQAGGADKAKDATKTRKPNIIFLLADDHRWDLIGKYHAIIQTPNLDSLADNGVVFKNAFVTTPICATSRASILTGLTERTHDYTFGQPPVEPKHSSTSYPQILKQNGYRSGFVGKYGTKLAGKQSERFHYFEGLKQAKTNVYEGKEIPQTYYMAERAIDFIEESSSQHKTQPWSVSISFWNPHAFDRDTVDQYHYPPEMDKLYKNVTIPPAKLATQEYYEALPEFLKNSIAKKRWQYRYGTEEIYQKMVKRHYRAISGIDKAIGMLRQRLAELGLDDNTIIIYTGDNGYSINDRLLAGKWFGWEEDLRVPLIIYDPRKHLKETQEHEELALNIDITSTILDLAGLPIPDAYQGKSLLPLLDNKDVNWREDFFFEHMYASSDGRIPATEGVRSKEWKYVRFYDNSNYEQLYHLKVDPEEEHNLASQAKYEKILQQMRARTDSYAKQYENQREAGKRPPQPRRKKAK